MKGNNFNKKIIYIIIGIMICLILGLILGGIIVFISTRRVAFDISTGKETNFIETYKELQKQVKENMANSIETACDETCSFNYQYDNSIFDFEVKDKISYYELEFEVDDDKYPNFRFSKETCSVLHDSYCYENEIKGRVYKTN